MKRSCSIVARVPHISTKGLPRRAHNSFALDRRATVLYCLFCQHLLFHSLQQSAVAVGLATNVPDLFFLTSFVFVSKMHHFVAIVLCTANTLHFRKNRYRYSLDTTRDDARNFACFVVSALLVLGKRDPKEKTAFCFGVNYSKVYRRHL